VHFRNVGNELRLLLRIKMDGEQRRKVKMKVADPESR